MGVCVVEAQDGEGSRPRDQLFAKYTCLEDQMIRLDLTARDVFAAREDDVAPLGENSIGCIRLCRTGSAPSRVLGAV